MRQRRHLVGRLHTSRLWLLLVCLYSFKPFRLGSTPVACVCSHAWRSCSRCAQAAGAARRAAYAAFVVSSSSWRRYCSIASSTTACIELPDVSANSWSTSCARKEMRIVVVAITPLFLSSPVHVSLHLRETLAQRSSTIAHPCPTSSPRS